MKWIRHLHPMVLPLGRDGRLASGSPEHAALSKEAALEGAVLLKNERNALPIARGSRIVLLGKAGEEYVKGGGGSGDVTVRAVKNIYSGMLEMEKEGLVSLYTGLHEFYCSDLERQYAAGREPGMTSEPVLSDTQLKAAAAFSDTAVLCISRFSGEGWDRHYEGAEDLTRLDGAEAMEGERLQREKGKALFRRGDFYLSDGEEALFAAAKEHFAHIIVVLNVGGMVDSAWFACDDRAEAVLYVGQGGMEGGLAAAELLCGKANPSGKLVDTFAKSLGDYPSTAGFHESADYVAYTEDIYVGYRYFETIPGAAEKVNYPFGFGLSYTTFAITPESAEIAEDTLTVRVKVRNTGSFPGKEVVQLYYSAPQGKLGKPKLQLGAFCKTGLLAPEEETSVTLTLKIAAMASYDDTGKVCLSAWVLEKGDYRFFVGNSSRNLKLLETAYTLYNDRVTEQLTSRLTPKKLPARMLADGSYESLPVGEYAEIVRPAIFDTPMAMEGILPEVPASPRSAFWAEKAPQLEAVADGRMTVDAFLDSLSMEETVRLLGGQPNTGVANTFGIGNNPAHGIPNIMTADGPAGLRIAPELGIYTTAWPCATTLASTWNTSLVQQVGSAAALEIRENNIGIWLAPGMNIHRSPLCGRNFEYYSEDPLIAGAMGSAIVTGVQSRGIGATPKHFACNNKETNRKHSDSRLSERAAREIYLKGFEIVVKNADPWLIMSSYNLVNGTYSSENRELLTGVLREDWGFNGMVVTDWWTRAEHWRETKAGNDVKMGNGYPEELLQALEDGRLTEQEVRACASRMLRTIVKMA